MAEDNKGQLALVTGAARRLGRDLAVCLAELGYDLILHYHDSATDVEKTRGDILSIGSRAYIVQGDLADSDDINRIFNQIDDMGKPLKIMVNSASVMKAGRIGNVSLDDMDLELDLNLRAPFICAQSAAMRMKPGGVIINISDVGASKTWTRYPAYSVSKAGLDSLTRILAKALAPAIRVNAIAPGLVYKSDGMTQKEWDDLIGKVPMRRAAQPVEIKSALEFLVKNEYVTGQIIYVDGGYSLV